VPFNGLFLNDVPLPALLSILLLGTLQACVGSAAGIELKAFVDSLDQMPDLDAILRGEDV
jgi:hypothetical protein